MTTQSHIAKLAKTSLKTVSRVINKDPLVNAETRARVEAIIAEVGYEPSQAARMMRSQKSNIIGFLADKVATTSSSIDLIRGAQDVAWERGKHMMLFNFERGTRSETLADSQLSGFRAEAIIYATIYHQEVKITASDVPHVLLNCFEAVTRFPTVIPDDYQLAFDLTERILASGYRRPLFLNLPRTVIAASLRARGFVDAGAAAGLDLSGRIIEAGLPLEQGGTYLVDRILPSVMQGDNRPDLILCGQDLMAVSVYFVLQGLGFRIGQDIAVASFDNLQPFAGLVQPGLSTMELPYYKMGRAAMEIAIDGMQDARVTRMQGKLIARQSM